MLEKAAKNYIVSRECTAFPLERLTRQPSQGPDVLWVQGLAISTINDFLALTADK